MAVVYLAHDVRHDRKVALKVLRPELVAAIGPERFLREIRLTASLQHPHILPLHDSGEAAGLLFYVMPFVEGESLRDRLERERQLPVDQALQITRQMAAALDYAHRHGVIHRDIKPENVLIHDGQALVADFGIALAVSQAIGGRLTETGTSIGTPQYMSPEQALGETVIDARSDVYSLACVLYEMLAGDPPHNATTAQAITARKLSGVIPPLRSVRESVSLEVERVVLKALAAIPADRYPTMAAFSEALDRSGDKPRSRAMSRRARRFALTAIALAALGVGLWSVRDRLRSWRSGPPRFSRVAILPLQNATGDTTQNYLVDGMTESLIADLARMDRVDVIALASVSNFRSAAAPVDSVVRRLGVDAVVEGSVRRIDQRLVMEFHLIAPGTGTDVRRSLERPADQAEQLERDVAEALAREIGGRLVESSRASGSANSAAHDLYLKGRYHLNSRSPEGLQNALDYFRQALTLDPANAAAYAGLAQYYSVLPFYTNTPAAEAFSKAKTAALRALELNPFLAEAHASLAYVLAYSEWDWTASERSYRRALTLQPSGADAHHALSRLLAVKGRIEEAMAEARRAFELDPLSLVAHANIGIIAYFGRDYDEAARRLKATLEIDPQFSTAHWGLGLVHEQQGHYPEAIAQFEKAMSIAGRGTNGLASLGHVLGLAGRRPEAEMILQELLERARSRPIWAYQVALVLVGLERNDEALDWLERTYQERSTLLSYIDRDPRLDPLRTSPRFTLLLERMRLTETPPSLSQKRGS